MKKLKALGISILVVAAAAFVSAIDLGDDYWTAPHIAILFLIGEVTYLANLFWDRDKDGKNRLSGSDKLSALVVSILVVFVALFISALEMGQEFLDAPHLDILFLIGEITFLAYLFWKKGKSDKQDGPDRPDELDES